MFKSMIKKAIFAIMAVGITGMQTTTLAAETTSAPKQNNAMQEANPEGMEKCYGVVKAGMNDCGNSIHSCSGEAKTDRNGKEWVFVPTGLCARISGGSTTPSQS